MRRLEIRSDAKADLADIYEYTLNTWGRAQAEVYTVDLELALFDIQDDVTMLRPIGERPGVFRLPYHSHQVIIRLEPDTITILRILHERMGPLSHI